MRDVDQPAFRRLVLVHSPPTYVTFDIAIRNRKKIKYLHEHPPPPANLSATAHKAGLKDAE